MSYFKYESYFRGFRSTVDRGRRRDRLRGWREVVEGPGLKDGVSDVDERLDLTR